MGFYGLENPNPTTPQFAFPRRGGAKLSGTCIVHTAEMYGALNTAAFCMRRSDYGCYHTVVDDKTIIEIYPYEYETWQDSETNNWAVGISAACKAADWNAMSEAQREGYYRNLAWAGADFVKYMKEAYGIDVPLRRLSGAEARARVPGFCAHGDSGIARSDPGTQFDWDRFFIYIREELEGSPMATPEQIAAAVWSYNNGSDRDAYQHLRDIAAGDIKMTNFYGTRLTIGEQLAFVDKNLNDARDLLLASITGSKVKVDLNAEQIASLAESLKEVLAPDIASELAKRLAE